MAAQIVQNSGAQEVSIQKREAQNIPSDKNNGEATDRHPQHGYTQGDTQAALRKRVSERTPAGREQNPELLQWRANVLLDEMMLGAVDIAANDTTPTPSVTVRPLRNGSTNHESPSEWSAGRQPARTQTEPIATAHPTDYANGAYPDGMDDEMAPTVSTEQGKPLAPSDPQDEWLRPSWHFAEPTAPAPPPPSLSSSSAPPMTPTARADALQEHTRYHQAPAMSANSSNRNATRPDHAPDVRTTAVGAPPPRPPAATAKGNVKPNDDGRNHSEQWVFAAEQRYQQIAARHQAPAPEHGQNGTIGAGTAPQWVDPVDALFDNFPANDYGYSNGTASTGTAGGRLRANQAARRSNLLPRMSNLDPRTLQQEMVLLQTEIEQALPAGHESRERALRLLQKAYTILHADPSRSAEVDYYLQQVRTISQRVQETLHWSTLYHKRLQLYLSAWTGLSLIVIAARYVYAVGLTTTIANFSNIDPAATSSLPYNLLTMFTAFFAGALGGALGAFVSMRYMAPSKQGFFDRKYSLRGLILPLIGGIVGLLLCLCFGLIYYLVEADPAVNLLLGALPALLAFGFGITQELIYGSRG